MKFKRLGRTGTEVPIIVFGCGNVGGLMIHTDDDTMHGAIAGALEAGITWFDTAGSYGQGKSEENLGRLLEGFHIRPRISTKVRLQPDDLGDIPGEIERHAEASLERLRRDRVELLQFHNGIEAEASERSLTWDQVAGAGGAIEALEKLRDQGLTKWIGFTALGDNGLCQDLIRTGRVDTAQVYYNMLNPSAGAASGNMPAGQPFYGLLDACAEMDVGVIAIRALAAGVLATKERHGREVIITDDTDLAIEESRAGAMMTPLGTKYGTWAQTALRFALSENRISCVDFAPGELTHLEEAIAAVELGPMEESDRRDIETRALSA